MRPNKHTPGPWTVETQHNILINVTTGEETRIPYYEVGSDLRILAKLDSGLNDQANAALIAAAPEMFEALEAVVELFSSGEIVFKGKRLDVSIITKALAKARGES